MPNLLKFIKKFLFSKEFINKHKTSPEAFTRQHKLPFHLLVCFLLNLIKGSYQSELDSGEVEILITSLIDKQTYSKDLFAELYHKRWPVEEDYKTMKCRMEIEAFTGKSVLSVYQDFHAQVFFKNLVAVMAFPVQAELTASGKKEQYEHQINPPALHCRRVWFK